jgi:hypothetical protein
MLPTIPSSGNKATLSGGPINPGDGSMGQNQGGGNKRQREEEDDLEDDDDDEGGKKERTSHHVLSSNLQDERLRLLSSRINHVDTSPSQNARPES